MVSAIGPPGGSYPSGYRGRFPSVGPPNPRSASVKIRGARTGNKASATGEELTPQEQRRLERLKRRDAEIRRKAEARVRSGQPHTDPAKYEYERGPDGKLYAKSAQVAIDASEVPGDPQATVQKMKQLKRVAQNAADPYAKDEAVASRAEQAIEKAKRKLAKEGQEDDDRSERRSPSASFTHRQTAADRYKLVESHAMLDLSSNLDVRA